MKPLTAALGLGPNKQVVTFIQELRERMTGIDRQRRQQGKNFLLKIAPRPSSAFRAELTHLGDSDAVFGQLGKQLLVPECILRSDQFAHNALDAVESIGGAQPVWTEMARLAFDLLLDSSYPNLKEFIQVRAKNGKELNPLNERLRRILRFFEHATIEFQPAQLAIDEVAWIRKMLFSRNFPGKDLDVRRGLVR